MEEGSVLVQPDEVVRRGGITVAKPKKKEPLINYAGTVRVDLESEGRFSLPKTVHFNDFTVEDINSLSLSRQEEILNNLVAILNTMCVEDISLEDATIEEFLEILVSIKQQFSGDEHVHPWMCDCQAEYEEADQKQCDTSISLSAINRTNILELDEKMGQMFKDYNLDEDAFQDYLITKYGKGVKDSTWTIEKEAETIQVKEPFFININNDVVGFEFPKIKHWLDADTLASTKFKGQIDKIKRETHHGVPLTESKQIKEDKLEVVNKEKAKLMILYSKALAITTINGKELNNNEKLEFYRSVPRSFLFDILEFLDTINFGINEEFEFTCQHCKQTSKRWLQQEINPLELLPFDSNTNGKTRESTRPNIFFGV